MYLWFARFVSGSALFLCSLFAGTASASANDDTVVMQVGRNTKTMHPDLRAMRFVTEPPTEDEDWAYSIVINAIFHEHTRGNTKIDVPILRDVTNVGGAYGVIQKGERYML